MKLWENNYIMARTAVAENSAAAENENNYYKVNYK
jgi:hypothetical protein